MNFLRAACSKLKFEGKGIAWDAFAIAYSARQPFTEKPVFSCLWHKVSRPEMQCSQEPQAECNQAIPTRSPSE